jgi:hypothetical protein
MRGFRQRIGHEELIIGIAESPDGVLATVRYGRFEDCRVWGSVAEANAFARLLAQDFLTQERYLRETELTWPEFYEMVDDMCLQLRQADGDWRSVAERLDDPADSYAAQLLGPGDWPFGPEGGD